jgi:hypothetical protein
MRRFARAQAHLRSFAFGNSHKKGSRKAGIWEKTNAVAAVYDRRGGCTTFDSAVIDRRYRLETLLQLQLIQRAPIWRALAVFLRG